MMSSISVKLLDVFSSPKTQGDCVKFQEKLKMRDLTIEEVGIIDGGAVSDDAVYGASLGVSGGFLVTALVGAALFTPVGLGILAGASIVASSVAIYTALK